MENNVKKERVWELDAFRGLFIIGMVAVHTVYDLTSMFGLGFNPGALYTLAKNYGAILFIVLSGISATFGTRFFKRGITVLGFGLAISAVMALLNAYVSDTFGNIYFGILHLLGVCMLLSPLFKKMPVWVCLVCAAAAFGLKFYFDGVDASAFHPLVIFGASYKGFSAVDHFPLFPYLGWFALGIVLGRTLYGKKKSLLPQAISRLRAVRFLMLCGRHSLWIYVLHQPIVYGVLWLVFNVIG